MQPTRQDLISRSEVRKMIERKIEIIKNYSYLSYGPGDMERAKDRKAILYLEELLSEFDNLSGVSGWIPVTERLPDGQDEFIVAFEGGGISTLYFGEEGWEDQSKFYKKYDGWLGKITHWMPLPPHP